MWQVCSEGWWGWGEYGAKVGEGVAGNAPQHIPGPSPGGCLGFVDGQGVGSHTYSALSEPGALGASHSLLPSAWLLGRHKGLSIRYTDSRETEQWPLQGPSRSERGCLSPGCEALYSPVLSQSYAQPGLCHLGGSSGNHTGASVIW